MPTILLKKSDTPGSVPGTANLTNLAGGAEVAVNTADKRMFSMTSASAVIELGTNPSSLTCADASLTVARIGSLTVSSLSLTNVTVTSATVTTLTGTSANITTVTGTTAGFSSANITQFQATSATITTLTGTSANVTNASAASLTVSTGNLTFSSTGQRITGDFSGTNAARLYFQSSTTNGATSLSAMPNGTGTQTGWFLYAESDLTNNSFAAIRALSGIDMRLQSGISGTGTYLPMTFYTGGSERMRLDTSGNLGIGTTPSAVLTPKLQVSSAFSAATASTPYNGVFVESSDAQAADKGGVISLGGLYDASSGPTRFAAIAGLKENGTSGNYAGYLAFYSRANGSSPAERMRIDSSGNVGIGMTPSTDTLLEVYGSAAATCYKNVNTGTGLSDGFYVGCGKSSSTDAYVYNRESAPLIFGTANAERMRIDSSGNVGIGTSNPGDRLDVVGGNIRIASGNTVRWVDAGNIRASIEGNSSSNAIFSTAGSERMRISSGGELLVGATALATGLSGFAQIEASGTTGGIIINSATNNIGRLIFTNANTGGGEGLIRYDGSNTSMQFYTNAGERMRITSDGEVYIAGTTDQGAYNLQCNGTGVWGAGAYVNGSDARLKDNIQSLDSGLDVVKAMRPVTFQYKPEYSKDQSVQPGFIAQELQTAMAGKPYLEGVVQEGTNHLNVAYQNIIPILVKAIQELEAKVAALEAK